MRLERRTTFRWKAYGALIWSLSALHYIVLAPLSRSDEGGGAWFRKTPSSGFASVHSGRPPNLDTRRFGRRGQGRRIAASRASGNRPKPLRGAVGDHLFRLCPCQPGWPARRRVLLCRSTQLPHSGGYSRLCGPTCWYWSSWSSGRPVRRSDGSADSRGGGQCDHVRVLLHPPSPLSLGGECDAAASCADLSAGSGNSGALCGTGCPAGAAGDQRQPEAGFAITRSCTT